MMTLRNFQKRRSVPSQTLSFAGDTPNSVQVGGDIFIKSLGGYSLGTFVENIEEEEEPEDDPESYSNNTGLETV